jgi:hypothetical protein
MAKEIVTIPSRITKGEELVIIPRSLYEKFFRWEKELKEVLEKVERGKRAYREGKTYIVKSPRELLKK